MILRYTLVFCAAVWWMHIISRGANISWAGWESGSFGILLCVSCDPSILWGAVCLMHCVSDAMFCQFEKLMFRVSWCFSVFRTTHFSEQVFRIPNYHQFDSRGANVWRHAMNEKKVYRNRIRDTLIDKHLIYGKYHCHDRHFFSVDDVIIKTHFCCYYQYGTIRPQTGSIVWDWREPNTGFDRLEDGWRAKRIHGNKYRGSIL